MFNTALLLDRFYTAQTHRERPADAQRRLLAAVCTVVKVGPLLWFPRDLVNHLASHTVPFHELIASDVAMLRALRFVVQTPSASDFLEDLWFRLRVTVPAFWPHAPCWSLGLFLLHLAMADAELFHGYPHAVLAAACLHLALQSSRDAEAAASAQAAGLAVYLGDAEQASAAVQDCVGAIHRHWVRSCSVPGQSQ